VTGRGAIEISTNIRPPGIELTGDNADPNAVMPLFTYEAAGG
jgi:hypothetical protein